MNYQCDSCQDRGVIQVAFGKSGEMRMIERRCPQCSTTHDELQMAKSQRQRAVHGHNDLSARVDRIRHVIRHTVQKSNVKSSTSSISRYLKSHLGTAWEWRCSCGVNGRGPTQQEAVDNWVIHREEAAIPRAAQGPEKSHHQLVNVFDTRDSSNSPPPMSASSMFHRSEAKTMGILSFIQRQQQ